MLTLAAGDTIAAVADAGSVVTLTMVGGMQLNGGTEAYSTLYQGQLAASAATIYTAPSSTQGFVRSITVVNTSTTTAHSFQLFKGGTGAGNQITPTINLPAGGMATYEDGYGWSFAAIPAGTTILNDIHPGYSEYQGITNPAPPSAGSLREFAREISGRMFLKVMPPSGLDNPLQSALFGNNIIIFTPYGSTTVTPNGFGTTWAKGGGAGTVSTPTPSAGIINQMKRVRQANAITTANQAFGIISTASGMPQFWRGNAAGLGGFFFFARFAIGLSASKSERLFCGLTKGTAEVVTSNTVANDTCGLWHDDTDGDDFYFMTRDTTTTHKGTAIPGTSFVAGQGYDFYMFAKPNDSTIYYRLDDINAGTTLVDSSETNNLPTNTTFMGPQVEMSNGASDTSAANIVAIDINRIYVESDH